MATYYMQLKPKVLDYLEAYETDFTKHDKKLFRQNPNTFFMGIRKTGTNLMIDKSLNRLIQEVYKEELEKFTYPTKGYQEYALRKAVEYGILNFKSWIISYNEKWFHGRDGNVNQVSKELLKKSFCAYLKKHITDEYEHVGNYTYIIIDEYRRE